MNVCLAAAKYAQSRGIPVVLDGGSWKEGTEELLNAVDMTLCSSDFTPPGCEGKESTMDYLFRLGVCKIAITAGENPIRYASREESGEIPVPRVSAVDTLGAGDIFHGAFCYYYSTNGGRFRNALECASVVASRSCESAGTRAWMTVPQ